MAEVMTPNRYRRDHVHNVRRRLRREAARVIRDAERAKETEALLRAAERALQQREARVVHLPGGVIPLGALAGSDRAHPFVPDGHTGTLCMACFGWCNDYRHWTNPRGTRRG